MSLAAAHASFLRLRHQVYTLLSADLRQRLQDSLDESTPRPDLAPSLVEAQPSKYDQPVISRLPLPCPRRTFDAADLALLAHGELARVFGAAYNKHDHNGALRLPSPVALDRVVCVSPSGGTRGLGTASAEHSLLRDADAGDDGNALCKGAAELLAFFALYAGLHTLTRDGRLQARGAKGQGQPPIMEPLEHLWLAAKQATYRLDVTGIGLGPEPWVMGDVELLLDGVCAGRWADASVCLVEGAGAAAPELFDAAAKGYSEAQILELASGSIPACCGPAFASYAGRRGPRLPNGDLQFIARVREVGGQWQAFNDSPFVVAEYDVPTEAWFVADTPGSGLPLSVLMELGLQPCGFLSFWLGSTFLSPEPDLRFRNLDGQGHLLRAMDPRGRRIESHVTLTSSAEWSGLVIQKFAIDLLCEDHAFYRGTATCGYFHPQALQSQVGLDGGRRVPLWSSQWKGPATTLQLHGDGAWLFVPSPAAPALHLVGGHLDLLDSVTIVLDGGTFGAGYVQAERTIDPADWFYASHFYQDPVMPGSLGVEAMVQALQAYARVAGLGAHLQSPRFAISVDRPVSWTYRGQILPTHSALSLELHIKRVERMEGEVLLLADGSLWGDGLRIYAVRDLSLRLVEQRE